MINAADKRILAHKALFVTEIDPSAWQINDLGERQLINILRSKTYCSSWLDLDIRTPLLK